MPVCVTARKQIAGIEDQSTADLSENVPPDYPLIAVHNKLEGVVELRISVAATGDVQSVEIAESSGYRMLDQAAVKAVSQ